MFTQYNDSAHGCQCGNNCGLETPRNRCEWEIKKSYQKKILNIFPAKLK